MMGNLTGTPYKIYKLMVSDGQDHGFRVRFSPTNQSIDLKWLFFLGLWYPQYEEVAALVRPKIIDTKKIGRFHIEHKF